jgi:hypothetical protein
MERPYLFVHLPISFLSEANYSANLNDIWYWKPAKSRSANLILARTSAIRVGLCMELGFVVAFLEVGRTNDQYTK